MELAGRYYNRLAALAHEPIIRLRTSKVKALAVAGAFYPLELASLSLASG
jgi:hypothetical protein